MSWSKPAGPRRVWRDLELVNPVGKKCRFTIEEIPQERYGEAIDFMCKSYVKDEVSISTMKVAEDPEALVVLRYFWSTILKQGISIAAFDKSSNDKKLKFAGVNALMVADDELNHKLKSYPITHVNMKKYFAFHFEAFAEGDPRKLFNVDFYLGAFGFSVDPEYRGFQLGYHLLDTRNDIGRAYNLEITATLFSSARVQKIAAAVGFKDHLVRDYGDVVDEDGEKLFPSLAGKQFKIMIKELV